MALHIRGAKTMTFKFTLPALAVVAAAFAAPASAAVPVYSPIGTPNATTYTFSAAQTGKLNLWYLGGVTVGYTTQLRLLVNGVERDSTPTATPPNVGAPKDVNWLTTWGDQFDFGLVNAGDTLEWKIFHIAPGTVSGTTIYSDVTRPSQGGTNNVWSTGYAGGDYGIAAGSYTFVAFEDILGRADPHPTVKGWLLYNDYDYNDFRFAYNVTTDAIPEPATWAMLITGFGLVGFAMRRRKAGLASVSA
jgi:hypothetical protein